MKTGNGAPTKVTLPPGAKITAIQWAPDSTHPMQSERLYQAVRGNGGTVRLVMLPHEAHNYRGRESVEHTLYEVVMWFDRYVKNAPPRQESKPPSR